MENKHPLTDDSWWDGFWDGYEEFVSEQNQKIEKQNSIRHFNKY